MNADWSLTDRSTWIALASIVAMVAADIFHRSFASYVPAAATVAVGLVVGLIALGKHHYRAAITTAASAVAAAVPQAPATPVTTEALQAISQAGALLAALTPASQPVAAPQRPPAAPVTPTQPAAAPAAPAAG